MSYQQWVDGVDAFTAADAAGLQDQGVIRFATEAARLAAIPAPTSGMFTWVEATKTLSRWDGTVWRIAYAEPLAGPFNGTPPSTTDASASVKMAELFLSNSATYRIRGLVRVTAGTCKLTSICFGAGGFWGNASNGEDAGAFDQTSADAIVALVQGINVIDGVITTAGTASFAVYYFNRTGSAVVEAGSFVQAERIA